MRIPATKCTNRRGREWVIFFDVLSVNLQPYIFGLNAVKALAWCWYHGINAVSTQADTRGVNKSAIITTYTGIFLNKYTTYTKHV